nr:MAG TPA: hypothetical protein [Caudoviricetes sp.]DAM87488.1 MAG TPA: hypothetical protein [Bacteriophage sp.]DAP35846.1 MAG TPA: hypothetical protein [Bacteriophage sp.]
MSLLVRLSHFGTYYLTSLSQQFLDFITPKFP